MGAVAIDGAGGVLQARGARGELRAGRDRPRRVVSRIKHSAVMPGLVPGIHVLGDEQKQDVDGRDKPRHDEFRLPMLRITLWAAPPLISSRKIRHGPLAMTNQPFFTTDRDSYIPTTAANGPWHPQSLHGGSIIDLLAFLVDHRHGADHFGPARLTVDMFRLP